MTPEQGGGTKVLINILGEGDNERLEEKKIIWFPYQKNIYY